MDRDEFSRYWMPHSGKFYRIACHLLENREDARDAVQDLYVRLWNSPSLMEKTEKPLAYAMMMLRNMCIDRIRRGRHSGGEDAGELVNVVDEGSSADSGISMEETVRKLACAMSGLNRGQKRLLRLRLIAGLGYSEISRITGISEPSLRVTFSMTRKQLKHKFEGYENDR